MKPPRNATVVDYAAEIADRRRERERRYWRRRLWKSRIRIAMLIAINLTLLTAIVIVTPPAIARLGLMVRMK
jgi:hypothetical protein